MEPDSACGESLGSGKTPELEGLRPLRLTTRVGAVSTPLGTLSFEAMTQADAESIADWHYEPPYDFYDPRSDEEDLAHLLDPERRSDRAFSARDESGDMIGFFTYVRDGDAIVLGLGLRPDRTGNGLGLAFLEQGLRFGRTRYVPGRFKLSVAEFNARATTVYERAGFVHTRSFVEATNGGSFAFLEMERPA